MPRILFFVFIAFVVWTVVRMLGTARKRSDRASSAPPAAPAIAEPIVQCAWCGVHVPAGQLVALPDGRRYCGDAHRDAARAASAGRS